MWNATGRPDGGHAVTLVGYKESGQYFKFINSWGTNWGDRGYGRLSYDALLRGYQWTDDNAQARRLSTAAYTLRVPGMSPPRPEPWPEPEPDPIDGEIELPKVSCGHLEQRRVDGQHKIIGFVREQEDLDKIREAVGAHDIELDIACAPGRNARL
ncbi:MAG: C1 family peptidase [Martelella sp.]|uniref:C1 family peptidase n=1 Tax=Martelella sp. TaxID=1969699 RepID=UPI003242AB22